MTAEYLRLHAGQLQTSVRQYTHDDTGRTVTVIGTYLVGSASYWQSLHDVIATLEAGGAVVHSEGTNRAGTNTGATGPEQPVYDQWYGALELAKRRILALGWSSQLEGLGYRDSWRIVDLSILETIRVVGLSQARVIAARLEAMNRPGNPRSGINLLRLKLAVTFRVLTSNKTLMKVAAGGPAPDVLVNARNEHALAELARGNQDTVLIWGVKNLPGLHDGLTTLKFTRSGPPQWHTVTPTRPSILRALLRLVLQRPVPHVPAELAA